MPRFADRVRRLERLRRLLRKRFGDVPVANVTHPVEHALRAILSEEAASAETEAALERLRRAFVDWNDLRVSRPREIREALGADFPRAGQKARVIPRLLDQVFKQYNSMVWDFIEPMSKTEVRTFFERLEEVRPFVAAVLARDTVGTHAFPVDADVARVLGRLKIVDPTSGTEAHMQEFLERAVKANRAFETHGLVKRLGEMLCLVDLPLCGRCPLNPMCPSALCPPGGKPKRKKEAAKADADKKPAAAGASKPSKKKPARRPASKARPAARRKRR